MGIIRVIANKILVTFILLITGFPIFANSAESDNKTTGKCSPIISGDISGDFTLKCDDEDIMPFFFLDLSCSSYYDKESNPDLAITNFYNFMKNNNGRAVVIELLESPPAFCESIEGLPKRDIVDRFKESGEFYSLADHQSFVYQNELGDFFRFKITPEDPHSEKASQLSAKLTTDCGHACAHWRVVGIPSTTYISGDGSTSVDLDIAPHETMFSERYLETMDEVERLKETMSSNNHFSFSKAK